MRDERRDHDHEPTKISARAFEPERCGGREKSPAQNSDHGNTENSGKAPTPKSGAHRDWLDERGIEHDEHAGDDRESDGDLRFFSEERARDTACAQNDGRPNQRDENRDEADREMPTACVKIKTVEADARFFADQSGDRQRDPIEKKRAIVTMKRAVSKQHARASDLDECHGTSDYRTRRFLLDTMNDIFSALRIHIVAIAVAATITFGFLFRGIYPVELALLCGFDWCIVNLLNRATDVEEDRLNEIVATEWVARNARGIVIGTLIALVFSLILGFVFLPRELAVVRVVFHVIGLGYSFRIVPAFNGMKRFKDLYVLKNSMSAVLFILGCGLYPLLGRSEPLTMTPIGIACVLLYFFIFEHSFEVIYDLRDVVGDKQVGVPTYPVVHGVEISVRIVTWLCVIPILILVISRIFGSISTRELLMIAAPIAQLIFLKKRGAANVTRADCIGITYAGALTLIFYLAGTFAWAKAGLPNF